MNYSNASMNEPCDPSNNDSTLNSFSQCYVYFASLELVPAILEISLGVASFFANILTTCLIATKPEKLIVFDMILISRAIVYVLQHNS